MEGTGPDAFAAAVEALGRKERTTGELVAWLEGRGHASDEVTDAVARLSEAGILDDERFARAFADDKRELRGWGAERIREALAARGLAPAVVEAAVEGDPPGAQVARASDLLSRRRRPLAADADRARALAFLTRRGYDYEIAYEAVRRASGRVAEKPS